MLALDLRRRVRRVVRPVIGAVLDRVLRIDTVIAPAGEGTAAGYQPSDWMNVVFGLQGCAIDDDAAFIDLGCGKGRALYVASWYPFRRLIGVEIDPELARVARQNVATARAPRRFREATVLEADARTVALPAGLRVAYLFNPFRGDVFQLVARRLRAHADAHRRPIRVIYANPVEAEALQRVGFVPVYATSHGHVTVFDYTPRPRRFG
jgi:SAM-dependent methyltransferase